MRVATTANTVQAAAVVLEPQAHQVL